MRLRLDPEIIDPHFFVYFVRGSRVVTDFVRSANHGMTRDGINTKQLLTMPVPVAPRKQQRGIIESLDSYSTRLDKATVLLERVQRNLKRYRASVLKAAVEGRLVPTEAELARAEKRDYEPASVLLERILVERRQRWEQDGRRGKYEEPKLPDLSGLPELPEGWCWATPQQLCASVTDGDHQPPPQTDSGVPFLVIGNVRTGELSLDNTRYVAKSYFDDLDAARRPKLGDVLYTVTGSFGIPVLVRTSEPFCVQRHIAILRPLPSTKAALLVRFLDSLFVFRQAAAIATGIAQMTVPLQGLRRLAIPLPPAAEQNRITAELERLLSIIKKQDAVAAASIHRSSRLRQSMLKWAFEGKLVDQDPNDEPASVLLKRIRDEREQNPSPAPRRSAGRPRSPKKESHP